MADLRIVDAPEIPTENITGQEKLPTGGSGNYSITLDSVADYTKTKKDLADNTSVDGKVNGVRQELDAHIEDLLNPHQVTKGQIGLGNVDNTADADKPVSNSTQAAITTAVQNKADKSSVYTKSETYSRQETQGLVDNKISTALSPISSEIDYIEQYTPLPYNFQNYAVGQRVTLSTGEIVENLVPNNNVDPNTDMLGWVKVNSADQILDESGKTQQEVNNILNQTLLDRLNVRDFGAVLDGTPHYLSEIFSTLTIAQVVYPFATSLSDTLDYCAYQAAINYAATKGFNNRPTLGSKFGRGGVVYQPSSRAVINKPLIMPRIGNYDGAAVMLQGEDMTSTSIQGTSDFPTNRSLIEWEDTPKRVYWQGISNITFALPNVDGVKAVHFGLSSTAIAGGSTNTLVFAEYLHGFQFLNVSVEGTNEFHENCFLFDGYVRYSKFDTIRGNIAPNTNSNVTSKNTRILKFDTSVRGMSAGIHGESSGIAFSQISNVFGMGERGGRGVTLEGRFYECVGWNFHNGNGSLDTTPVINIQNSRTVKFTGFSLEGRAEKPEILVNNSIGIVLENLGLGSPDSAGCDGISFTSCSSCTVDGRYAPAGAASFYSKNGKAIRIDANSSNIVVNNFYITQSVAAANEFEVLGTDCVINYVDASNNTKGVYPVSTSDKPVIFAKSNALQTVVPNTVTKVIFGSVDVDTKSLYDPTTGEFSLSAGMYSIRGTVTINNAKAGIEYSVNILRSSNSMSRCILMRAQSDGILSLNFNSVIRSLSESNIIVSVGINHNGTADIQLSQYAALSWLYVEKIG